MTGLRTEMTSPRLLLKAVTAAEIMTPTPVSIRAKATVPEAVAMLTDRGFSAAPVIDEAGRAVGVLSRADILVHDRERDTHPAHAPELPEGFTFEEADRTLVEDLMTPVVFSVTPETTTDHVIEEMLALHIHQLYVVDADGLLVGVISTLDVLRHLKPE